MHASLCVRVVGTASAPRFQLDPAAATELLKAGLTGSGQPAAAPVPPKPASTQDRLNSLNA